MPKRKKKKFEEPEVLDRRLAIFLGTSPRDGEIYDRHGLKFHKGIVYEVSKEVFEFLKAQKHFKLLKGMADKVVDFP